MAGIIGKQLNGAQAPNGQGMNPMASQMTDEGDADPDTDPAFQQAATLAMEALYSNQAAKDVAKSLRSAASVVDGLADTAYEITSIIDERTDGQVPDELLVPLAAKVLEEVGDIAEAAGIAVTGADVAEAMKKMILRFLGEQGIDTTQLEQAMSQIDPQEFNNIEAAESETAQEDAAEGIEGESLEG